MSLAAKDFIFPSCEKIFLSLPRAFGGQAKNKGKWEIESGEPLFGLELFPDGTLFGFAPLVSQNYSTHWTVKNNDKIFLIKCRVLPPSEGGLEKRQRKAVCAKNNYLQYGFGKSLSENNDKNEAFYIKILDLEKARAIKTTAFEESVKACRAIGEKHKNLSLCFSGGADSMAMLSAFLESKVNFKIYIWRDKNNLIIDSDIAAQICRRRGLNFEFVEMNAIKFFESGEYLKYCEKYRALGAIELAMHIKFLENTPGTPVLAGDPPTRKPFNEWTKQFWADGHELDSYSFFCLDRYFKKAKRAAVANFLLWSVEQFASFANSEKKLDGGMNEYYRKCELYRLSNFPFSAPDKKYFGNEKIREYYEKKTGDLHFFDKKFRYKALLAQKEMEPWTGYTVEPDGFFYFPANLTSGFFSEDIQGFKRILRG